MLALTAVALGAVAVPAAARGETRVQEDARVSVWIPAGWRAADEDHRLTLTSARRDATVILMVVAGASPRDAVNDVRQEVARSVRDIEVTAANDGGRTNGMPASSLEARGTMAGRAVEIRVAAVRTPTRRLLVAVAVYERRSPAAAAVRAILASPRPLD